MLKHARPALADDLLSREIAQLVWDDSPEADKVQDPRTAVFADAFLSELATCVRDAPGALKRMMIQAMNAAEVMNVVQFQGLVECIQNADDVRATEVRFAIRNDDGLRQLLVVHDGQPVLFGHIFGMALPFYTSKTEDISQRGRFGIGLKTLRRIADTIAIHSNPYHFWLTLTLFLRTWTP